MTAGRPGDDADRRGPGAGRAEQPGSRAQGRDGRRDGPIALLAAALAADLAAGFGLLTRLPVDWLLRTGMPYRPGRAVWCYPLAGALAGAIAAASLCAGRRLGLPASLAAGWTLLVAVWFTGGLHEDGLADLADGCGGGRTPERRLEIMRDSRIGAFGALALVLSLGIRLAALARLGDAPINSGLCWLPAIGALSRTAMLPVLLLPPARADGLGRSLGTMPRPVLGLMLGIGFLLALLLLGWCPALLATALSLSAGSIVARHARSRLGGRTGDVLGASVVATECLLLTLAAAWLRPG